MITWIVVTDGKALRVLELAEPADAPIEVASESHTLELSDQRWQMGADAVPGEDELMQGEEAFPGADTTLVRLAQQICTRLTQARRGGRFDRLVVAAPDEMLDVLTRSLGKELREVLMLEVEDDLINADATVIRASLSL